MVIALAGCGSGQTEPAPPRPSGAAEVAPGPATPPEPGSAATSTSSSPVPTETAPPEGVAKSELRMAVSHMESYRAAKGSYTSDVTALGSGFPTSVKVALKRDGYTLSTATPTGATFGIVMSSSSYTTTRTCSPPHPVFCHNGTW